MSLGKFVTFFFPRMAFVYASICLVGSVSLGKVYMSTPATKEQKRCFRSLLYNITSNHIAFYLALEALLKEGGAAPVPETPRDRDELLQDMLKDPHDRGLDIMVKNKGLGTYVDFFEPPIRDFLQTLEDGKLLEVGMGKGRILKAMAKVETVAEIHGYEVVQMYVQFLKGRYYEMKTAPDLGGGPRQRPQPFFYDVSISNPEIASYGENDFDAAFSAFGGAFEIPKMEKPRAFQNLYKMLRPGGRYFVDAQLGPLTSPYPFFHHGDMAIVPIIPGKLSPALIVHPVKPISQKTYDALVKEGTLAAGLPKTDWPVEFDVRELMEMITSELFVLDEERDLWKYSTTTASGKKQERLWLTFHKPGLVDQALLGPGNRHGLSEIKSTKAK